MNRAQLLSDLLRSAVAEQPITVGLSLEYAKEILELIDHLARIESAGGGVEEIRERHENPADPIDIDDALDYMASARRDRGTLLDVVARLHGELDACNETNKKLCADAISDVQQVVRERDAARAQVERLRKSEQYWLDERNRSERLYLAEGSKLRKVTSERDEALRVVDVVRKMRARLAEIQEDRLLRDVLESHIIIYPYVELLANMELPK